VEHRGRRVTQCDDGPPRCRSVDYCRRQPKLAFLAIGDGGKTRRRRCYEGSPAASDGAKPSAPGSRRSWRKETTSRLKETGRM
jgi:hypothetical protein